jgi:hypothetical protein
MMCGEISLAVSPTAERGHGAGQAFLGLATRGLATSRVHIQHCMHGAWRGLQPPLQPYFSLGFEGDAVDLTLSRPPFKERLEEALPLGLKDLGVEAGGPPTLFAASATDREGGDKPRLSVAEAEGTSPRDAPEPEGRELEGRAQAGISFCSRQVSGATSTVRSPAPHLCPAVSGATSGACQARLKKTTGLQHQLQCCQPRGWTTNQITCSTTGLLHQLRKGLRRTRCLQSRHLVATPGANLATRSNFAGSRYLRFVLLLGIRVSQPCDGDPHTAGDPYQRWELPPLL